MRVEDSWDEGDSTTHANVFHFVAEAVSEGGEGREWRVDCEAVEGIEEIRLAETVEVQTYVCGGCGAEGVGDEVAHIAGPKDVDFPVYQKGDYGRQDTSHLERSVSVFIVVHSLDSIR